MFRRTKSGGIIPGSGSAMLRSRSNFGEMIAFQDGFYEEQNGEESEQHAESPKSAKHESQTICGIDQRPLFPAILMFSIVWSMALTSTQDKVVEAIIGTPSNCSNAFFAIYLVTCLSMAYTAVSNPGYMDDASYREYVANPSLLPQRAFKHWLYKRPILRFHQYCRWVTNCIGLNNHREYMIMLCGFVTMAVVDTVLDGIHVIMVVCKYEAVDMGMGWGQFVMLLLHLLYSVYLAYYMKPLVQMHVGFVARNELTQEWKRDDFQIIYHRMTGEPIAVKELDEEEYDEYFDDFVYDETRNPWDRGCQENCWNFWCASRWTGKQTGEF